MSPRLIGMISRSHSVTLTWCLIAMELGMYEESKIIFERIQTQNGQFPENTCECLMWWVALKPEEATIDRVSLILRDMGLLKTAQTVSSLELTLHDTPLPGGAIRRADPEAPPQVPGEEVRVKAGAAADTDDVHLTPSS